MDCFIHRPPVMHTIILRFTCKERGTGLICQKAAPKMPHRCLLQMENTVIRLIQLRPIEKGQHRSEIHWPGFEVLEFQIERIHFCKSISLYQKSGYGFTERNAKSRLRSKIHVWIRRKERILSVQMPVSRE